MARYEDEFDVSEAGISCKHVEKEDFSIGGVQLLLHS
jgi:hypothetical protein